MRPPLNRVEPGEKRVGCVGRLLGGLNRTVAAQYNAALAEIAPACQSAEVIARVPGP